MRRVTTFFHLALSNHHKKTVTAADRAAHADFTRPRSAVGVESCAHATFSHHSSLRSLFVLFLLFRSPLAEAEGESVFVSSGRTHSQFALKLFALMQGNRQVACCCSHCSYVCGHATFLQKALLQLGRKTNWTADMAKQSLLWAEFNSLIGRKKKSTFIKRARGHKIENCFVCHSALVKLQHALRQ